MSILAMFLASWVGTHSPIFLAFVLIWFLGWGFLLLKFPMQSYRLLRLGKEPSAKDLKTAKFTGYTALSFGVVVLLEILSAAHRM